MNPRTSAIVSAITTSIIAAASMYGFGVQPANNQTAVVTAERDEYAANGQMIRDELKACLTRLETCWRECR